MKQIITLALLLTMAMSFAQERGINYKARLTDNAGNALANQNVTVRFSILEGNMGTNLVYQGEHTTNTDDSGIIIVNIGEGSNIQGDFNTINWGFDAHWLKTEVDTGNGFTEIGNTEFKTVPYALHAQTAETSGSSSPFAETSPNLVSTNNTNADFLVGSSSTEDENNVNLDSRLFFDKSKAAFRAGYVNNTQWNDVNRGLYSFATGQNNTASGVAAAALGINNLVEGSGSVAFGSDNSLLSSAAYSTAIGFGNYVSGAQAMAIGNSNEATGLYAFAGGNAASATTEGAFAFGRANIAKGNYTTVFGFNSLATPTSNNSFTAGYYLQNNTQDGTVIGRFNEVDDQALFNVGNGDSSNNNSAFKIMNNGDVNIDNFAGNGTRNIGVDTNGTLVEMPNEVVEDVYVVPFSEFKPYLPNTSNDVHQSNTEGVYVTTAYSNSSLFAPIHLPNNAIITKVEYIYKDSNTQNDIALQCAIVYQEFDASLNNPPTNWFVIGSIINTDNFQQDYGVATADNINWTITSLASNRHRAYEVRIGSLGSGRWSGTSDTAIFQVRIHYTH